MISIIFLSFIILHYSCLADSIQHRPYQINTNPVITNKQLLFNTDKKNFITVTTDVLSIIINKKGGNIDHAFLLPYKEKLGSSYPFHLLETSPDFIYQATSGLIIKNRLNNSLNIISPTFITKKNHYILTPTQNELCIPLTYTNSSGLFFIKKIILKRGSFALHINYEIYNNSNKAIELKMFGQLKQTINIPDRRKIVNSNFAINPYRGAVYSSKNDKYRKYSFKNIKENTLNINTNGGWIAMLQQYFTTAWIPLIQGENNFFTNIYKNNQAAIGFTSSTITIPPISSEIMKSKLWIGPTIQDKMSNIAPYLDLTVDYGWLWFISQPLFKLLKLINSYINNWGISIIMITLILRILMYPLTKSQYQSMTKLRKLQPQITALSERYGNNKQKYNEEMIALYKSEKVNPLSGFLPIIIQMPLFLALYYMLLGSIELRHAPFLLWINDLSSQDPYYILPILMGISMLIIQKFTPKTINDPIQNKIMNLIPIIFIIFFLWVPSGLVLYYIVSNLVTIIQHQLIDITSS